MEKQLVNAGRQPAKSQSGLFRLAGKLTGWINSSKDKRRDKEYLDLDLFSQMTYMAAISSSGLARGKIFQAAVGFK